MGSHGQLGAPDGQGPMLGLKAPPTRPQPTWGCPCGAHFVNMHCPMATSHPPPGDWEWKKESELQMWGQPTAHTGPGEVQHHEGGQPRASVHTALLARAGQVPAGWQWSSARHALRQTCSPSILYLPETSFKTKGERETVSDGKAGRTPLPGGSCQVRKTQAHAQGEAWEQ